MAFFVKGIASSLEMFRKNEYDDDDANYRNEAQQNIIQRYRQHTPPYGFSDVEPQHLSETGGKGHNKDNGNPVAHVI